MLCSTDISVSGCSSVRSADAKALRSDTAMIEEDGMQHVAKPYIVTLYSTYVLLLLSQIC
jgi:hypothetical protein